MTARCCGWPNGRGGSPASKAASSSSSVTSYMVVVGSSTVTWFRRIPWRSTRGVCAVDFDLQPSGTPVDAETRAGLLAAPAFGRVFTDHMVAAQWTKERGWHDGRLTAYA